MVGQLNFFVVRFSNAAPDESIDTRMMQKIGRQSSSHNAGDVERFMHHEM